MTGGKVLVITGTPAVGKSTVARALASGRPRAAHVKPDALQRMIVSGGEWPSADTAAARRQMLLRLRNAAALAKNLTSEGFDVVIDEVLSTSDQVRLLEKELDQFDVIGLTTSSEVVLGRDAGRTKHTASLYLGIEERVRAVLPDLRWVDSTHLSVDDTVAAVAELVGW